MSGDTNGKLTVGSNSESKSRLWAEKLVVVVPLGTGELTFGEEMTDVDRTSDFTQSGFSNDSHIHQKTSGWSVFGNYSISLGKFSIDGGVRWQNEHNHYYEDNVLNKEKSPDYSMLTPSLSLSYSTGEWNHRLYLSTYRNNPPYSLLSSAVNYRSKFEYDTGNPFLKPTSSYMVGYTVHWKWMSLEPYFQFARNMITSFQSAYDDIRHPGIIIIDYRNIPTTRNYGISISLTPKIGIWQLNYTVSLEVQDQDLQAMGMPYSWKGLVSYFNLDNTFNFSHGWMLNVTGSLMPYYESGSAKQKTNGGVNLRLNKSFLKDKSLRVAFVANDIFHTQWKDMTAFGGIGIRTQFREYRDQRRIGIDLSYSFNAAKTKYKGKHAGQSERNRL